MKPPSPMQRWLVLGTLLLGTVTAAFLVEDEPVAPAEGQRPARHTFRASGETADGPLVMSALARSPALVAPRPAETADMDAADTVDPFRSKSWYVAPPPPPPPKPSAPPLPFQFLGQLIEEDGTRVFVNHHGRHLIIKAGDVIAGTYAVEEIGSGRVVFIYLPLKERQVLPTGASQGLD